MSALTGQQGPDAPNAGAVIRAAVIVFAIAIAIVAPPARPVRQIHAQYVVDHFHGVDDARIIRSPQTEPYQSQRISADQLVGSDARGLGEAIAYFKCATQFSARFARYVRGDTDVVTGNADFARQTRVGDVDPVLDLLIPRVRGVAEEISDAINVACFGQIGCRKQRCYLDREGEWGVAGIFLPAILSGA